MKLAFAIALTLLGCAHGADGQARSRIDARVHQYADESGLAVTTAAAEGQHELSFGVRVVAGAQADHVVNEPKPKVRPKPPEPGQPSGHFHPGVDVVSTASVLASDEQTRTDEWRFEGTVGAAFDRPLGLRGEGEARLRGSTEPDYRSLSARFTWRDELFEKNTAVAAFALAGHDVLHPVAPPPGQASLWPASHARFGVGGSLSQLLSPELVASTGIGVAHQWGMLANPYRRALVVTSLFPEAMPPSRVRLTVFGGLSWYLGGGTALHFRQGAYADSWGVWALIPEAALAKEVGRQGLVSLRYRHYAQGPAAFYRPSYDGLEEVMTGDPRLGALRDHVGGVELRWTPIGRLGWKRSLTLVASYELSVLHFLHLRSVVRSEIFSAGISGGF